MNHISGTIDREKTHDIFKKTKKNGYPIWRQLNDYIDQFKWCLLWESSLFAVEKLLSRHCAGKTIYIKRLSIIVSSVEIYRLFTNVHSYCLCATSTINRNLVFSPIVYFHIAPAQRCILAQNSILCSSFSTWIEEKSGCLKSIVISICT